MKEGGKGSLLEHRLDFRDDGGLREDDVGSIIGF